MGTEGAGLGSWNVVECRGMSWNVVECRGMSWNVVECRGMSWNVVELFGSGGTNTPIGRGRLSSTHAHVSCSFMRCPLKATSRKKCAARFCGVTGTVFLNHLLAQGLTPWMEFLTCLGSPWSRGSPRRKWCFVNPLLCRKTL